MADSLGKWLYRDFDISYWVKCMLLPIFEDGRLKYIAATQNSNLVDIGRFRFVTQETFTLTEADKETISEGLKQLEKQLVEPDNAANDSSSVLSPPETVVPSSVVSEINHLIRDAVQQGASDIHFEPFDNCLRVRFRVDGSLREVKELTADVRAPAISRLKIMGGLDIAERRMPQDGRIRFHSNGKLIDLRLSTLPTDFGEKAVLRILDKSALRLDLNMLGMSGPQLEVFRRHLHRSNGIILVTGPTGSGKTTTLYSALNEIRSPELNITSIEDPIEYNLHGISQTQIKPEIGLNFSHVLRSVLRQDPNVIMVGEIRDSETLQIAIRAALTGHLVLSTVHTNDSVSTISRLVDLQAERGLLASALRLVIAQRLVRTLCPHCKAPVGTASGEDNFNDSYKPLGCEKCYETGYLGRRAIFEFLEIDRAFAEAIEFGSSTADLYRVAQSNGLIDLRSSGMSLVKSGVTDTKQILREVT